MLIFNILVAMRDLPAWYEAQHALHVDNLCVAVAQRCHTCYLLLLRTAISALIQRRILIKYNIQAAICTGGSLSLSNS